MDDELNEVFDDELETSDDPKICSECEREFEGEGDMCPACESEDVQEDQD